MTPIEFQVKITANREFSEYIYPFKEYKLFNNIVQNDPMRYGTIKFQTTEIPHTYISHIKMDSIIINGVNVTQNIIEKINSNEKLFLPISNFVNNTTIFILI